VKGKTMGLSSEQVERFYRIWLPLLRFVNEQRQIIPDFPIGREKELFPLPIPW